MRRYNCGPGHLDQGVDELRQYASARSFTIVEEYVDAGISGARAKRPALDKLLQDAHRRRFDAVLIWRLDRLGRSLAHLIRVVDQLGSLGVDLVSLGDVGLDTTSSHGKLIFSIMASVAEFERSLAIERTKAGMQAARRRGKRIGRPRVYIPVGEARRLLARGMSLSAAARELGVARTTLHNALSKRPTASSSATA